MDIGEKLRQLRLQPAQRVEVLDVRLRRKQLLIVMLSVNIEHRPAECTNGCSRGGDSVNPKAVFAGYRPLTLHQHTAVLFGKTLLLQYTPCRVGNVLKCCRYTRAVRPGPNQFPACPLPEHCVQRIDNNGLTRTRFTGQNIQSRLKIQRCAFNNRNILDM